MAGLIYYDNGNKWRYENPGTADLLSVAGTTVTGLDITQSRAGIAFYQTQRVKCFDIPATNEIWIKCDVYHTGTTSRFRVYDDKNGSTANGLTTYSNSTEIALWSDNGSGNFECKTFSNALKSSVLQTYLLHMRTGDTNGLLELWLDGEYKGSYTGNVNNGQIFENIFLQSDSSANLFSNVIISNSEIGIDENVNPIGISWNYLFDTKRIAKNPALAQRIAEATKVLLHFDDENNPWKDECGNEWTAYKSPSIGTDNATFEKGLQLSGGSYIYTSQPILFGGKDFTIDFLAYAASSQVSYAAFLGFKSDGTGNGDGKNSLFFARNGSSSNLRYGMWNNSGGSLSNQVVDTTFLNRRRHYALVYQHETLQWKIFVDGQLVFSTTLSQAIIEIERYIFIGRTPYSGSQYFNGTIDEFRIVDGIAIWTENFTPPIGPWGAEYFKVISLIDCEIIVANSEYENILANATKVLMHFDESLTLDECGNTWTAYGDAVLNSEVTKFGGSSVYLPSGAYLRADNIVDINAAKWTFDCWCRCSGSDGLIGLGEGSNRTGIDVEVTGVWVAAQAGGSWQASKTSKFFPSVNNVWTHLAIVRNGNTLLFFENGNNVWETTISGGLKDNGAFMLGGNSYGKGCTAYFDEVRFVEGIAIWTENFTPPTKPYLLMVNENVELLADTIRYISNNVTGNYDTARNVTNPAPLELPLIREIESTVNPKLDLLRIAEKKLALPIDAERNIIKPESLNLPTVRDIIQPAIIDADLRRDIYYTVGLNIDLTRKVTQPNLENVSLDVDVQRNITNTVTDNFSITRNVGNVATLQNDTLRDVSNKELGTFDTCRDVVAPAQNISDLARNVTIEVTLDVDIQREVKHIWRYENAGTAEGLKVSGTTVTVNSTKSKTGTAFWQTNRVATFPIPATKELWVKFDLYYGNAQWRAYDRLNGNDTGIGIYQTSQGLISYINGPTSYLLKPQNPFTTNKLYTVLLHMVSGSENGLLECWVDGEKYYSEDFADEGLIYKGNVENGAGFENFYLQTPNANNLFSNVIISNERIGLGENVINHGLISTLDFDVVRDVRAEQILVNETFHLVRNVLVNGIWLYENPGTADSLINEATTVTNLDESHSKTGTAFYQLSGESFDIPAAKEIWCKFDVYLQDDFDFYAAGTGGGGGANGLHISYAWGKVTGTLRFCGMGRACSVNATVNNLYTFLLHMVSDSETGLIEVWLDGDKIATETGNLNNGKDFDSIIIKSEESEDDEKSLFSNVLISNGILTFSDNVSSLQSGIAIDLSFDLLREITNNFLSWRYENYGTSDLLLINADTVSVTKDQSKYCSGFYNNTENVKIFDIPATNDIWIKFDFSTPDAMSLDYNNAPFYFFRIGENSNDSFNGVKFDISGSASDYFVYIYDYNNLESYDVQESYTKQQLQNLNTGLIYMKSDSVDGEIKVWINGQLKCSSRGNVNNGESFENISLSAKKPTYFRENGGNPLFSNIIISNSEIGFNDNCKVPVEALFDTERYLTSMWSGDTWRYENYGTADFLSVEGTTVAVPKEQSKYYSGFYQTQRVKCFDIPATNEIWIKCDVYHTGTTSRFRIYDDKNGSTANGLATYSNSTEIALWSNNGSGNFECKTFSNALKSSVLQTYLLHMRTGDTNGLLELWLDGEYKGSYTGNVNNGQIFENIFLQSDSSANLFSNVIISNAEIGINDNCKVPIVDLHDLQRRVVSNFAFEDHCDLLRNICSSRYLSSDLKREIIKSTGADYDTLRNVIKKRRNTPMLA